VAGGSDMPQKLVYIHSITPGSLADKCNKFKVGDQIVMAGNDLMVGLTWKAASDKINQLVGLFTIVAQRRENPVAELEEKQQKEKIHQSRPPCSFESGNDNDSVSGQQEKEKPSANTLTSNSQASQQYSDDINKVISAQPPIHTNGDEAITFTVKVSYLSISIITVSTFVLYS